MIDTLLRESDPARDLEPAAAEAVWMDTELHRRIAREPVPRRRRRAPLLVLAAAAAGVAALVVALPGHAPQPASAATVLRQLSAKTAQAPPQTGRYAYSKEIFDGGQVGEQWVADDGSGYVRNSGGSTIRVEGMSIHGMTVAQVQALPTDPAALRAALLAIDETVVDGKLQVAPDEDKLQLEASGLLASPVTPQPVKVALFGLLQTLPSATVLPDVADPQGRHGIGIQFGGTWRELLVFEPATGALLAMHATGPGTDTWISLVETGRTDTPPSLTGH